MSDALNSVPKGFEIIERANCFRGFYKLDKLRLRHELFAGGMGREISRELFVRHDAVCVLPYDPQRDEVVLIEQFRVGALDKVGNPADRDGGRADRQGRATRGSRPPRSRRRSRPDLQRPVADDPLLPVARRQ